MQRNLLAAIALVAFVSFPNAANAAQGDAACVINTGLNPACPITSVSAVQSTKVFSPGTSEHTDTLFGSLALRSDTEIDVALPLYRHLNIPGVGQVFGTGDIAAGYSQVVRKRKRVAHVLGLQATFPTGALSFSNGRMRLAPFYAVSYALGSKIALVGIVRYAFDAGGTKLPFAPRTERVTFVPRAIVDLSKRGLYAAADIDGSSVTGEQRYQEYVAEGTLGFTSRRYGLSVTYREPIARYTWNRIFNHALEFQLRALRVRGV